MAEIPTGITLPTPRVIGRVVSNRSRKQGTTSNAMRVTIYRSLPLSAKCVETLRVDCLVHVISVLASTSVNAFEVRFGQRTPRGCCHYPTLIACIAHCSFSFNCFSCRCGFSARAAFLQSRPRFPEARLLLLPCKKRKKQRTHTRQALRMMLVFFA